jgi:hypothetical protein
VPRRLSFNMCLLETLCPLRWIDREREAKGCGVGRGMAWGSAAVCGKGSGLAKSMSVYQLTSRREGRGRGGNSCAVPSAIPTCHRSERLRSLSCILPHNPLRAAPKMGDVKDVPTLLYQNLYTVLKNAEAEN